MWETIKNNVLLKTIAILLMGILGFGLAFNIMFGRNTGMMGQEMGGGYSLESTLSYILMILVEVLFIAIVLATLIAVCKSGKKYLFEGRDRKMFESYKNDPLIKTVSVIIAAVFVIALFAMLFNNIFGGYGMMQNYHYSIGVAGGFGMASVLVFLVKLLLIISVVGLIASVIFYTIQKSSSLYTDIIFKGTSNAASKVKCSKCGTDMKQDWKCCPNCGEEMTECKPNGTAPVNDAVDAEQEAHLQVTTDELVVKEEINGDLDSKNDADIYENTPAETIEQTEHRKNRKNKR